MARKSKVPSTPIKALKSITAVLPFGPVEPADRDAATAALLAAGFQPRVVADPTTVGIEPSWWCVAAKQAGQWEWTQHVYAFVVPEPEPVACL